MSARFSWDRRTTRGHRPRLQLAHAVSVLLICLPLLAPCAFALDPSLHVSQYAHTSWKVQDGFPAGTVRAIAQTPDGYLWIGTEFGLVRFDGVRGVPMPLPAAQRLPSNSITSLLVTHDGTLWIGTANGLASWNNATLRQYSELSGRLVASLVEDHEHTVWAGTWGLTSGRLCAIRQLGIHCEGENKLGPGVLSLYEDGRANLWAGTEKGFWRWKPGPPTFYPAGRDSEIVTVFAADSNGDLFIGVRGSIQRLVNNRLETAYSLPSSSLPITTKRVLLDRDGAIWIGTADGIVHVHQGKTDIFTQLDGLSGNRALALFQDREHNIWVGTQNGLDRFREFGVATFSAKQGFSTTFATSLLSARDNSLWFSTTQGLSRLKDGQLTIYGNTSLTRGNTARFVNSSGLSAQQAFPLFEDAAGRIWISTASAVGYMEHDRYVSVSSLAGAFANSMVEVAGGDRWIARQALGLFRITPTGQVQQMPWRKLGHEQYGSTLIADPGQGLWIGFSDGGIIHLSGLGEIQASYAVTDGLARGRITGFRFDADGALWASGEGGLSRLKNGRIATLTNKDGLPCDDFQWLTEDDAKAFWLSTPCGLLRILRPQLDAWAAAVDKGESLRPPIQATVFENFDGVRSTSDVTYFNPAVAKSSDGKLWFSSLEGLSVIDPRHLPFNPTAPPVYIEEIVADGQIYTASDASAKRLHARVRDVVIDYTALSLVAPEKMRFRYKLEGMDTDWQDAGTRRQAFYNNLPPRNYRFRVMASNNSGIWNETGASLDFSVASAYYQTTWFRLSILAAFCGLLVAIYQLRLRQVAHRFDLRVQERMRVAQDLHDTLLQGCLSAAMQLHLAVDHLPDDSPAKATLTHVQQLMTRVIDEGRIALRGLRFSNPDTPDLEQAFLRTKAEVAPEDEVDFRVVVEGRRRPLHPLIRDEVYRIGREAILNAFRHAHAKHIEVEIDYAPRQLRVLVRDDGRGIDLAVATSGREGHFGLSVMRERAERIGGRITVASRMTAGTEVDLTVPGKVAFQVKPSRAMLWLAKLGRKRT